MYGCSSIGFRTVWSNGTTLELAKHDWTCYGEQNTQKHIRRLDEKNERHMGSIMQQFLDPKRRRMRFSKLLLSDTGVEE